MINSFVYELQNPTSELKKIELHGPTAVHNPLTCSMQSMLMKVLRAESEGVEVSQDNKDSDQKIDGTALVTALMMAKGQDDEFYARFCDKFKNLLLSANICKINDSDQKLQVGHFNFISQSDFDKLMGEYLSNFLLPSIISQK